MSRDEMIRKQREIGLPECWRPQFIVAALPRDMAAVCQMWHELPAPGASAAELAEVNEFIALAINSGARGFFRQEPESRRRHLIRREGKRRRELARRGA